MRPWAQHLVHKPLQLYSSFATDRGALRRTYVCTSNDLSPSTGPSAIELLNEHVCDWRAHVRAMQDGFATFGRGARRAIDDATVLNDVDTADLFTEISRGADKSLWGSIFDVHQREGEPRNADPS